MALSADRQIQLESGDMNELPVLANTVIYKGAFVGISSGYARGLVALDEFAGIAEGQAGAAVSASGDHTVRVITKGKIVHAVTGASGVGDINDIVYASDDGTLTLTSTNNTAIGKVYRWHTSTTCTVEFWSLSNGTVV